MRIVIVTLSILFAACVLTVAIINHEPVTLRLWPDTPQYTYPDTAVTWVIISSAFAGFFFTGIVAILEGSKTRLSNARLRAQVRRLQQEIDTLRRAALDFSAARPPALSPALPEMDEAAADEEEEIGTT